MHPKGSLEPMPNVEETIDCNDVMNFTQSTFAGESPPEDEGRCLLCLGNESKIISRTKYGQIWDRLRSVWGFEFSPDVVQHHPRDSEAELRECTRCGLQYFFSAAPGNSDFYGQMSDSKKNYYATYRWEFSYFSDKLLTANAKVLDLACGGGQFLKFISDQCESAYGIDINDTAIAVAKRNGLNVDCRNLQDFSDSNQSKFDFVVGFHVIEHVSDIYEFVRQALRCVKQNGCLIISMPNRDRSFKEEFEPLDYPPHHLSRWSKRQIYELARIHNCKVERIDFEPIEYSQCIELFFRKWFSIFPKPELIKSILRRVYVKPLHVYLADSEILQRYLGLYGISMFCVLRRDGN
jgi:SAM-dependent methyltransferase